MLTTVVSVSYLDGFLLLMNKLPKLTHSSHKFTYVFANAVMDRLRFGNLLFNYEKVCDCCVWTAGARVGATVRHLDAVSIYFRFSYAVQDGVFHGRRVCVRHHVPTARRITTSSSSSAAAAAAGPVLYDVIAVQWRRDRGPADAPADGDDDGLPIWRRPRRGLQRAAAAATWRRKTATRRRAWRQLYPSVLHHQHFLRATGQEIVLGLTDWIKASRPMARHKIDYFRHPFPSQSLG